MSTPEVRITEDTVWPYLQLEMNQAGEGEPEKWIGLNDRPLVNREGVDEYDMDLWRTYLAYLRASRHEEYRVARITRSTKKEILDV